MNDAARLTARLAPLAETYRQVRQFSERLVAPLSAEDCMVQSMDDVSPTRWHLAHTTWFFETFILAQESGYQRFDEQFHFLFNSYYNTLGQQFPRGRRGHVSRPGLERIMSYRRHVDEVLLDRLQSSQFAAQYAPLIQIGVQHEQQHQELILTDIKHVLACNPTWPKYQDLPFDQTTSSGTHAIGEKLAVEAGLYEVGFDAEGFSFDNESPRHKVYVPRFELERQLVTCGEYLEFMAAEGYSRPEHWLSLGWSTVNEQAWQAPLYWQQHQGQWWQFTLAGLVSVDPQAPVTHVSFFEADAYARWRGARLPTEFEWEIAAAHTDMAADEPFVDYLLDHQLAVHPMRSPHGLCGGVWQWTSSSYLGYPGYRPAVGAVGEYNGKFMCDQHVLRGGSVATHRTHVRPTYRNFFPATARWQFSGIRLAK